MLEEVVFLEEDVCLGVVVVVEETLSFHASVISGGISGVFCEDTTAIIVIAAVIRISNESVTYIPLLSCGLFPASPFFLGTFEF